MRVLQVNLLFDNKNFIFKPHEVKNQTSALTAMLKHPKQHWHYHAALAKSGHHPNSASLIPNNAHHLYIPAAAIVNLQNGTFEPLNAATACAIGAQLSIAHQQSFPNISNQAFLFDNTSYAEAVKNGENLSFQQQQTVFAAQQTQQLQRKISSHSILTAASNIIGNLRKSSHNPQQQINVATTSSTNLKSPLQNRLFNTDSKKNTAMRYSTTSKFNKFGTPNASCEQLLATTRSGDFSEVQLAAARRKSSAPVVHVASNSHPILQQQKLSQQTIAAKLAATEEISNSFNNFLSQV